MRRESIGLGLLVLAALLTGGCGSTRSPAGFIDQPLDWRAAGDGGPGEVWWREGQSPGIEGYTRLMIDPISVWYSADSPYQGIQPDEMKIVTDYLHRSIAVELSDRLPLTEEPDAQVLRLRVAIVDLRREPPDEVLIRRPSGLAMSGIRKRSGPSVMDEKTLLTRSSFVIGATLQVEFLDAESGDRVGAYAEPRLRDAGQGAATWDEIRQRMDGWAGRIRAVLVPADA